MGANGELTKRKLMPAPFNPRRKGKLAQDFRIVGFSRTEYSDDEFRELMWKDGRELWGLPDLRDEWDEFARKMSYVSGDLGDGGHLGRLKQSLSELEGDPAPVSRLFYLSIAPGLYEKAVQGLGAAGFGQEDRGWSRIVVEAMAGTTGTVNFATLPGGSQFHGVGIRPTVPVSRTIQGVVEGRDEILERAIEVVSQ